MNPLVRESIRIGDELVALAQRTPEGWCWSTQHVGERRPDGTFAIEWAVTQDLYSGSAGIVFFLAELHRQLPNPAYQQAAAEGARWLWHQYQQREHQHYSLLTGWMGVAWSLLRVGDVLNVPTYHQQAIQIALDSVSFIEHPETAAEYFNGLAGVAIGLLLIHQVTNHPALLTLLDKAAQQLVAKARWGAVGLFYDPNRIQIRGLCGVSHGAAGVAAALLEIGHYLGNEAFYRLAFQLFQYEDAYYANGQWPDFRRVLESSTEQVETAFQTGDFRFFTEIYFMSAWCHGNVGIAPVRARAYALTGNVGLLPLLRDSVAQHLRRGDDLLPYFRNFTLCHGITGSLEMLNATASLVTNPDEIWAYRQQVIDRMLKVKPGGDIYVGGYANSVDEDTSLFMGIAGIGYTCLRLAFSDVPALLLPTFSRPALAQPDSLSAAQKTWADYRLQLLGSRYARTMGVLQAMGQWPIPEPADLWADEQTKLRDFVTTARQQLPPALQPILDEAWELDRQKAEVANAINPVFELAKCQRWIPTLPPLLALDGAAVSQLTLCRPELSQLLRVQYDWSQPPSAGKPGLPPSLSASVYILTWAVIDQVRENRVLLLGGLLLEAFAQPTRVADAWQSIEQQFDSQSPEQLSALRQRLYEQTRFFLEKGMLLTSSTPFLTGKD